MLQVLIEFLKPLVGVVSKRILGTKETNSVTCVDKLETLSPEAQKHCLLNQELRIRRQWWNRLMTYLGFIVVLILLFTAYETISIGVWMDDFVSFILTSKKVGN